MTEHYSFTYAMMTEARVSFIWRWPILEITDGVTETAHYIITMPCMRMITTSMSQKVVIYSCT